MRKEIILAVIIGIILGGIILYGISLANNSAKSNLLNESGEKSINTDTTLMEQNSEISFVFPIDNAVITDPQITLKGSTSPNLNLAIITENDDIITASDDSGNFSSIINLISGENIITVTIVDHNLATTSASITVIHTTSLPE